MLATGWDMPSQATAESNKPSLPAKFGSYKSLVNSEGDSPFVAIAEKVQPTVVNIKAMKKVNANLPSDMFDWGPFFGRPPQNRGQREHPPITTGGSGIIIDKDGLILTNNHVISGADEITVKFADESEYKAEIIGVDPETDVALIKVNTEIPMEMVADLGNSDDIRIGEWAIAIGNPFGLDWTVTVGVISARGRSNLNIGSDGPSFQNFIQTDASINFGNSGGPLVDIRGNVIGVNTAINAQGQGIGFAIPINLARKVADQLLKSGEVKRGYLGVFPTELDEVKREALGIDNDIKGIFIDSVEDNTPASEGGLIGGEVVVKIDGEQIRNLTDFRFKIADYPPDSKVPMTVWQKGKLKEMNFKLGDRGERLNTAKTKINQERSWLGINITSTGSQEGKMLGVDDIDGVLVIGLDADSPAQGLLTAGDVIVEISGEKVFSIEDYNKISENLKDRERAIPFWIIRNDRKTFVAIRPK